jgi:hypothetical protein
VRCAFGGCHLAPALLEAAVARHQPLDAVLQHALVIAELEVHKPSTAFARMFFCTSLLPAVDRRGAQREVVRRDCGRRGRRVVVFVVGALRGLRAGGLQSSSLAAWRSSLPCSSGSMCAGPACRGADRLARAAASA